MGLTIAAIIIILMAILAPIIHRKKYSKDAEGTVSLHLFVTVIFSVISGIFAIVGLFASIFAKDSFVPCIIILSLSFILTLVSLSTAIWNITYDEIIGATKDIVAYFTLSANAIPYIDRIKYCVLYI